MPRFAPLVFGVYLKCVNRALNRSRHRIECDANAIESEARDPSVASASESRAGKGRLRVAYLMSRFPKLTETFVLYEIAAVERTGVEVEIYPLLRQREAVSHAEAERLVERARFHPFLSWRILYANLYFLLWHPAVYVKTWWEVLSGTWGSWNFFFGGAAILPKCVRFAYEMQRQRIRHVHAHFASHPTVAALVIHRLTGIPFSFTAHGSDLHVDRRMLDQKIDSAAFVVAIAEFNKDLMIAKCGESVRDKVRVIHCGVDPTVFAQDTTRGRTVGARILCVASFYEVKGHRYLLQACRLLSQQGLQFECHLIGTGPLQRELEQRIAELDLQGRVILCGERTRSEIIEMLAQADLLVLASAPTESGQREGIPVALMEAMAAGLPVIASLTGGIPELIEDGETGFLVAPRDVTGLAQALETLINDPVLRERMGTRGRKRVLRDFNLERNATELAGLFRDGELQKRGRAGVGAYPS